MSLEQIFSLSSMAAMAGWLVLLSSPWLPKLSQQISALLIPLLLSLAYTVLIMAYWSGAEGGFGSLREVMQLFTQPELVLAGWIHYLAFDLFVGAWECRTARRAGIAFWMVVPCLFFTFMFGPAGFLLFSILRLIRKLQLRASPDGANESAPA